MNNTVLGKKIFENVRKDGNIKLVTTEEEENIFVRTKLSYYKVFRIIY